MSAFIVDRATIHALVHAAVTSRSYGEPFSYYWRGARNVVDRDTADQTGDMLIRENVLSIQARYPDTLQHPERAPGPHERYWEQPYSFPYILAETQWPRPELGFTLKQIDCYEYQSCETSNWVRTRAYAFCDALRRAICARLPGYEAAPWGVDDYPERAAIRT